MIYLLILAFGLITGWFGRGAFICWKVNRKLARAERCLEGKE